MSACRVASCMAAALGIFGALLYLHADQGLHIGRLASTRRTQDLGREHRRPNIVWVMADDLGVGEVGLFASSSPNGLLATPHLDQFGKEGLVFTQAYAGYTVCAPSRFSFFTGRHVGNFNRSATEGTVLKANHETTIVQILKQAGYATGAFGKVGPVTDPIDSGFDAFLGQQDQVACHNMYPAFIDEGNLSLNFPLSGNMAEKSRELCMAHPEVYNYTIDVFHGAALRWLSGVANGPQPFFLYYAPTVPHAGGWNDIGKNEGQPVPTSLHYEKFDWPAVEKDHAAVVTYLDAKIGELLERIRDLGIDNQTLVIFASDNGAHSAARHDPAFFNSTAGLRGQKMSLFEGGTRSPTMARWPGVISQGRRSNLQWAFWDVLPTLAELADASVPDGIDGRSIVPTLLGHTQPQPEYLFWTWGKMKKHSSGYAIRIEDWKGVVQKCEVDEVPRYKDSMELYDLSVDPFETKDVAKRHPGVVRRLMGFVIERGFTCQCFQCG